MDIDSGKEKERGQYSAMLTEQALTIKIYYMNFREISGLSVELVPSSRSGYKAWRGNQAERVCL